MEYIFLMSFLVMFKLKVLFILKILFLLLRERVFCRGLSCFGVRGKIWEFKCGNEYKRCIINFIDLVVGIKRGFYFIKILNFFLIK